ncbi:site-specific integrase [Afifella sp. IM 167]|uniref:tyrosine-type recombinase/integrase n=1 Tax=Afifella sp. IM 167 TaxID=2033586 RepID=UPI001CC95010|nr:site-specific integrase [Afifella sp. IM 167]MBZ8133266.1 integrase [Afifella sp. IM 167]
MPRQAKGIRLWYQRERIAPDGSLRERGVWCIRDGRRKHRTGFALGERAEAEKALADYIVSRREVPRHGQRPAAETLIVDVLNLYLLDVVPAQARPDEAAGRIARLGTFFDGMHLSDLNGALCRAYAAGRGAPVAARRELEDLRAAINHHRAEGLCAEIVSVVLPPRPASRERWLTRSEAARLIWAAWSYREVQKGAETDRRPLRHVARFVLAGLYTGTRAGPILAASFTPVPARPLVDLDRGVFYRRPAARRETKKRAPPVVLPRRLLAHLRRWRRLGQAGPVEWRGAPTARIHRAFAHAASLAGLGEDVTPHTLRHTCATWLMQEGVDMWQASRFLGMSMETLERVYGHHHPDHLRAAREALDRPASRRAASHAANPRGTHADSFSGTKAQHGASAVPKIVDFP